MTMAIEIKNKKVRNHKVQMNKKKNPLFILSLKKSRQPLILNHNSQINNY